MNRRAALALAALLFSALYLAASWGNAPGALEDDAVQIMLARSLRHGGFALPDAGGVPITDPLPGLAGLMLLPVWFAEPHWGLLRACSLFFALAVPLLTWRLARRLLAPEEALAATLLSGLCPALVRYAGFVVPDIPLTALALLLVIGFHKARTNKRLLLLAALAAWASLLRPQGALLALALGLALGPIAGAPSATAFLAAAFGPLGLWTLRNRWAARTVTGYVGNWRAQVAILGDPVHQINHAARMSARFFSEGLLGLDDFPYRLKVLLGAALVASAALGAWRLLRGRARAEAFAMSAFAIMLLALHLTWLPVEEKYVLPIAPFIWILALAGLGQLVRSALARRALLILAGAAVLRTDAGFLRASLARSPHFQGETMRWLRDNTPPDAGVESLEYNAVLLLSGRRALPPSLASSDAAQWLAAARANGIDYLHVEAGFNPGGYLPGNAAFLAANLEGWARRSPGVRLVYDNPAEQTRIFSLRTERPAGTTPRTP